METKAVFLRGVKPVNYKWLKAQAKKQGYTLSGFVNKILEEARAK